LQFADDFNNIFELRSFPAQGLSTLGVIPDVGLFQLPGDFD
jgi:hypothetical protein